MTEIREYRYRETTGLEEFLACEDEQGVVNPEVPAAFEGWEKMRTGDRWCGRDRYLWLHREVTIPGAWKGRRAVGVFDFGKTGGGNNSGFEAMCYINGKPYQGVDTNHMEVFFPEELCGQTFRLTFPSLVRAGRRWSAQDPGTQDRSCRSGLSGREGRMISIISAQWCWRRYSALETRIRRNYELRNALDQACLLIDWSYPGSEEFL